MCRFNVMDDRNPPGRPDTLQNSACSPAAGAANKDISILLLGQTGMGKSTWINGFSNHIRFASLQEAVRAARHGEAFMPVPMTFARFDPQTLEERRISTGTDDPNEVYDTAAAGESVTRSPTVYSFTFSNDDHKINIIDTPGLDDTRGRDHDRLNVDDILKFIASFETLHCICILFRITENRCSENFAYCVTEIMRRLDESASRNLALFFTHASATRFVPSKTLPILRRMFATDDRLKRITEDPNCVYCFENDSVELIATVGSGEKVDDDEVQGYVDGWNRSKQTTVRLMSHVRQLEPHRVTDTVCLNNAKAVVDAIAEPLMHVAKATAADEEDLQRTRSRRFGTTGSSFVRHDGGRPTVSVRARRVVTRPLDHPMTICGHYRCVDVVNGQVVYRSVCHARCVFRMTLYFCTAIDRKGSCKLCGHGFRVHKRRTTETVVEADELSVDIDEVVQQTNELKAELRRIIEIAAELSVFLKDRSLCSFGCSAESSVICDAFETEIGILERKSSTEEFDEDGVKMLKLLSDIMSQLKLEMVRLTTNGARMSAARVTYLIGVLFDLPRAGPQLKQAATVIQQSTRADIAVNHTKSVRFPAVPTWLTT